MLITTERQCGVCGVKFTPNSGAQRYCDSHKNRHAKQAMDRQQRGGRTLPPGYFSPRFCWDCGSSFIPTGTGARYCEPCRGKGDRWSQQHPEEARERSRKAARRARHKAAWGDPDIYDRLVAEHGERCGICGAVPRPGWHLAVDHDHETMVIRGLLCQGHNAGLGYFNDDPVLLSAAAAYLVRTSPC